MAVSRRSFLQKGVLAAAACASSPLLALGGQRPIGRNDDLAEKEHVSPSPQSENWQDHAAALNHLDRARFTAAIGTDFKVFLAANASPVFVTLAAVEDLPKITAPNTGSFAVPNKSSGIAPATSGFVLVFAGSSALPQDTHLFEHESLGRFALFTVPAGNGQQLYSAVVNRLDSPVIIAVPVNTVHATQNSAGAETGMFNGPGATSSGSEIPSRAPSGSPASRRTAVRD